jgi:anti-sigma factor RsiW
VGITCETVWRESSNYLDGTLDHAVRLAMDEHLQSCQKCVSVTDGLRNIVTLYGDERLGELPEGFSQRLRLRIEASIPQTRRNFFGWAVAFAASVLAAGGITLSRSATRVETLARSKHARHAATPIPPDIQVVVSENGKLFHLATCPFILNRSTARTLIAADAIQQGFTPCTRCMSKYL